LTSGCGSFPRPRGASTARPPNTTRITAHVSTWTVLMGWNPTPPMC